MAAVKAEIIQDLGRIIHQPINADFLHGIRFDNVMRHLTGKEGAVASTLLFVGGALLVETSHHAGEHIERNHQEQLSILATDLEKEPENSFQTADLAAVGLLDMIKGDHNPAIRSVPGVVSRYVRSHGERNDLGLVYPARAEAWGRLAEAQINEFVHGLQPDHIQKQHGHNGLTVLLAAVDPEGAAIEVITQKIATRTAHAYEAHRRSRHAREGARVVNKAIGGDTVKIDFSNQDHLMQVAREIASKLPDTTGVYLVQSRRKKTFSPDFLDAVAVSLVNQTNLPMTDETYYLPKLVTGFVKLQHYDQLVRTGAIQKKVAA